MVIYLCGFEHDLGRIIEKSQRSLGQSMRTHENSRELHIRFPWVHHLLDGETLKVYEYQVHESLYEGEIPAVAEKPKKFKSITHKAKSSKPDLQSICNRAHT